MDNELKVWRAKRRLNQRRTASAASIKYDRFMRIENGYAEPEADEQERLAAALDCRVRDIFPRRRASSTHSSAESSSAA